MTRLLLSLSALLCAGCATAGREPESLVDNPVYEALGSPSWRVAIGDDIALRLGHDHFGGEPEIAFAIYRYPRTLRREWEGVRRWQSGDIMIEARPGPCTVGVLAFADRVRVVHRGRELGGCGGRLLRPERGE